MPGCLSQGETLEELYANMEEAIAAVLPHSLTNTDATPRHTALGPSAPTHTAQSTTP